MRKDGKNWYQTLSIEDRKKCNLKNNNKKKLRSDFKLKEKIRQKIYRSLNRQDLKVYNQSHYQKNKSNTRKRILKMLARNCNQWHLGGSISAFDLWKIAKKQKLRCALTGEILTIYNVSADHIIPKSKGGINISSNIRLVLADVNFAKRSLTDSDFLELCRKVVSYSTPSVLAT